MSGPLSWKEFEVCWMDTQLFLRAAWGLGVVISGNDGCPPDCSISAPIPASAAKPGQRGETWALHRFGKEPGILA